MIDPESQRITRERDDVAMIDRPDLWPLYNILPLKLRGKTYEKGGTGALVQGLGYTVYVGPLGLLNLAACKTKKYNSAQEIVDDGWMVD